MNNNIQFSLLLESFITPIVERVVSKAMLRAIQQNSQVLNHKSNSEEILNLDEAADLLDLSKNTIYQKTSKNRIPFFKRGRKLYFKRSELLKWIEAGKQKTVEEVLADTDDYLMNRKKKKQ